MPKKKRRDSTEGMTEEEKAAYEEMKRFAEEELQRKREIILRKYMKVQQTCWPEFFLLWMVYFIVRLYIFCLPFPLKTLVENIFRNKVSFTFIYKHLSQVGKKKETLCYILKWLSQDLHTYTAGKSWLEENMFLFICCHFGLDKWGDNY